MLKKGTELYHATGEEFKEGSNLRGGGYDNIVWTTQEPVISQTYIPISGSRIHGVKTSQFNKPSKDAYITNMQKEMGIEFSDVSWAWRNGFDSPSYKRRGNQFKDIYDKYENKEISWSDVEKTILGKINEYIEKNYHYKPNRPDSYGNDHSWTFKLDGDKIMPDDYKMKGRLYVLTLEQDLKIFDNTYGGAIEGDLTNLEYHQLDNFIKMAEAGYDGVKINDYAQSVDQGNFGHRSIGLFPAGMKKVSVEIINGVVHHELDSHYQSRDWRSPEYKKHKNINEEFFRRKIREILINYHN